MWNNQDKTFIFKPPWIFSLSNPLKRRLWKYLECVPPLGRTGQRHTTICWTKLDPCLTQHWMKSSCREDRTVWKVICTFDCHCPGELPRGAAPSEEMSCEVQRQDRQLTLHTLDSPAQQSLHCEQWPCLSSRKWGAVRPNCSTHGTDSSIF